MADRGKAGYISGTGGGGGETKFGQWKGVTVAVLVVVAAAVDLVAAAILRSSSIPRSCSGTESPDWRIVSGTSKAPRGLKPAEEVTEATAARNELILRGGGTDFRCATCDAAFSSPSAL